MASTRSKLSAHISSHVRFAAWRISSQISAQSAGH
jgi:hypothetical protein